MDFVIYLLKLTGLHLSICYSFFKISNTSHIEKFKVIILFIFLTIIILFNSVIQIPITFKLILICYLYTIILYKITNITFENSFVITIISIAISFIASEVAIIISLGLSKLFNLYYKSLITISITSILNLLLVFLLFKLKRFRNGFPFLINKNETTYLNVFILIITTFVIFTYFLIGGFTNIPIKYLLLGFIIFSLIMIKEIQNFFILYQKQKIMHNSLKDYEQELNETKLKLSTALEEKQKLIKSNHEFYHRQEALKKKLDDLINQQNLSTNTEFGEDYGNLLDRINKLSDEYVAKTKITPNLTKTNITEIDDMFIYMQSECDKNNIEFILKIDCNVQYIIDNFISKSQLETLLGDLIRNAIIAINHSKNNYKSIMVVLGIKDGSYELCIYDSGIHFEINTLLNLGLKPASTHESEGGTGIGFITTFETIDSCNASFIINELTHNNYTKSLEIKFDNKHDYIIISNRCEEINKMNTLKRNIIVRK